MPRRLISGTTKIVKGAAKAHREYTDLKEKVIEQSVNAVETKANPLYFLGFLLLSAGFWLFAVFENVGLEALYEVYGLYPVLAVFIVSYFTIFLGSKLLFKPTTDEITDDTSIFAVFSACRRKEARALISIALGILHTLAFFIYFVSKDISLH